jgi:tRNA dimethylallyltransferase
VLLAGPTAGGKSALALRVAERDGGCVINADASQVYACWRILTARPDAAELRRAPHALYGHVDCARRYSVGDWLRDLAPVLDDLRARGLRPIIVGGTGLYFTALTQGLPAIPPVPPDVRAASQALLDAGRIAEMIGDLAREDPTTHARIDLANPMRVQRAWCVLRATGRGLASWQAEPAAAGLAGWDGYIVQPEIALLNSSISSRFDMMLEHGALDECRAWMARGDDPSLPSARVLGAPELAAHLRGEMALAQAVAAAVTATRQYAKRQRTWFRNRMSDWPRIDPSDGDPLARIAR